MKRRLLTFLSWVVVAVLILWIVRTVSIREALATLRQLQGWEIGALVLLNGLILLALNGRWWLLLRGQGHFIPFWPLLSYRLAAFGLSYVTPGPHFGGEPLQVLLIERGHGVPRSTAIAAMTLDKVMELIVNFAFLAAGVVAVMRWRLLSEESGGNAAVLLGTLACLPLGYLLVTSAGRHPLSALLRKLAVHPLNHRPDWQNRLKRAIQTIYAAENQAGRFYRQAPGLLLLAIATSLAGWLLMAIEYWLMVAFLGLQMTFLQLVTTLTAARIANLLLLPAGLGALETSQIVAFGMVGLDPTAGLSASLLIRFRDTLLAAIGLSFGSYRLRARPKAIKVEHVD